MKIKLLGTGTSQGVPVVACKCPVCQSNDMRDKRLRTSAMFEIDGKNIIIDCGPDFRYQMLRENISNIRAILLTHEHRDHIAGIDDVRSFNWINKCAVDIYAEHRVVKALKAMFSYAFKIKNKYPGVPSINIIEISNSPFYIDNIEVIPIRGMHAFLPVLGYRIGDIAYLTDFKTIDKEEFSKLYNCKILIINALRFEEHHSHFCVNDALKLIKQINPAQAYFTHIGHQFGKYIDKNHLLPDNVNMAFDGLTLEI